MYRVSGSNLFGQWLQKDRIVSDFRTITKNNSICVWCDVDSMKLIHIGWSYNIYQVAKDFYIAGDWRGTENQFLKIDIPNDCDINEFENLCIVGNDYNITIFNKNKNILWIKDLQNENDIKKINLNIEFPLDTSSKKARYENCISKVSVTNNSCLCLTADGRVYQGLPPSILDTNHCVGKVCDITCGYEHFMLLTDTGKVYTWGNGRRLQLGHGSLDNLDTPTEVEALAGIKITKIRAGGWHCQVLSEFGDLYTWGWNDTGQLGVRQPYTKGVLNTEGLKSYPLPRLVDLVSENGEEIDVNIKDMSCGSRHSAILLEDNSVWTTGYNKYGQLGFSPDLHPTVNYFRRAIHCKNGKKIKCGHWSTVIECNK
ncbi:hypothetical protein ACJJTC_018868 [Scirpophaga incertulas]